MQAGPFREAQSTPRGTEMWSAENEMSCAASGVPIAGVANMTNLETISAGHVVLGDRIATQAPDVLATFQHQCAGVQAALLSGALQQHAGRGFSEALKADAALTGLGIAANPGLHHQAGLPCGPTGSVATPIPGAPSLAQLSSEYWQQAVALAAVHHAAAAGQMAATFPIVGGPNMNVLHPAMTSLAGDGGVSLPVPAVPMVDELELKKQRRKMSNRESARRSRLRKQAELHEMIEEVRGFTVKNAKLNLEINYLRERVASMSKQNILFQGMISESGDIGERDLEACSAYGQDDQQMEEEKDLAQQGQKQTCWAAASSGVLGGGLVSEMSRSVVQ